MSSVLRYGFSAKKTDDGCNMGLSGRAGRRRGQILTRSAAERRLCDASGNGATELLPVRGDGGYSALSPFWLWEMRTFSCFMGDGR